LQIYQDYVVGKTNKQQCNSKAQLCCLLNIVTWHVILKGTKAE